MGDPTEYEITYTVAKTNKTHTLNYHLYPGMKDNNEEMHRIKAITRALLVSDEFKDVKLTRKKTVEEWVEL